MDRSTPIYLITETKSQNAIGEWVTTESQRKVYANVKSVTQTEYFSASQIGLNPDYKFTMFAQDWQGEMIVEYNGYRYSVYRVYVATTDRMELYAQREAGTATYTVVTTSTSTSVVSNEQEDEG